MTVPHPMLLDAPNSASFHCRLQLKCDGTRWRTGGEVKGKLANGAGSQYSSHYLGTWCIQHYYRWCAHLGCQQSTELTPLADLNGLVRFAERRNLVSARVPSHFKRSLPACPVTFYVKTLRLFVMTDTYSATVWSLPALLNTVESAAAVVNCSVYWHGESSSVTSCINLEHISV
jgi:hypothetical protein